MAYLTLHLLKDTDLLLVFDQYINLLVIFWGCGASDNNAGSTSEPQPQSALNICAQLLPTAAFTAPNYMLKSTVVEPCGGYVFSLFTGRPLSGMHHHLPWSPVTE